MSYSTVQPAWVQTASNATTRPPDSDTATAGSPLAGSWKFKKPFAARSLAAPTRVPVGVGAADAAAEGDDAADGDGDVSGVAVAVRRV